MKILFNDIDDIREDVNKNFGSSDNYLVVIKKNSKLFDGVLLLLSNSIHTLASIRTFILQFSQEGIYSKEITNNLRGNYTLQSWEDITEFSMIETPNVTIVEYVYKGSRLKYEISYGNRCFMDNSNNEKNLQKVNWHRFK